MLDDEPLVTIRNLIRDEWNPANTPDAADTLSPQDYSTGWYDYGAGGQQITVTNPSEDVLEGGDTGYTAGTGDGGTATITVGSVVVNCWPGTRDEARGVGPDGGDVNPKTLGYAYAKEVVRILRAHPNGVGDLNTLGTPGGDRIPDDEGAQVIYRWEIPAVYTYGQRNPGTTTAPDGGP